MTYGCGGEEREQQSESNKQTNKQTNTHTHTHTQQRAKSFLYIHTNLIQTPVNVLFDLTWQVLMVLSCVPLTRIG